MVKMKKSIAFFISFMVTIAFISILPLILNPMLKNSSRAKDSILPIILSIGLIFFMFFQGFLKFKWNKKLLSQSKVFLEIDGDNFTKTEKSWIYLFLVLIYFASVIANVSFKSISIINIVLFVVFLIISIFLLKYSEKTMKIIFTQEGIVVTGMDLRIDIPLGQPLHNTTGFYPYTMIDGYLPLQDGIELFIEYEQGKITLNTRGEEKNQILYILKQNEIEMRKYS